MKNRDSRNIVFVITVLLLVFVGIMMVFSSSFYYSMSKWNDKFYFFKRSIIWSIIGITGMTIASFVNYKLYRKIATPLLVLSGVFLVLVLTSAGTTLNNAKRWIYIFGFSFTPSEFAKLSIIIFMAHSLEIKDKYLKSFKDGILSYLIIAAIYFLLIILQPNLSTAITIVFIIFSMMYVAGMRYLHLFSIGILGAGVMTYAAISSEYRLKRLLTFLNPFEDVYGQGWQVVQSLYALGMGGIKGVGLGKSVQNKLYLPEPQNDFIFATIGEELGFIGSTIVILLFIFLIYQGIKIALNAPDRFSFYLATGIISMISIQTIMNIAVATSSMPVTGVSLPFISFGGNSLLMFMISIGILINISRNSLKK